MCTLSHLQYPHIPHTPHIHAHTFTHIPYAPHTHPSLHTLTHYTLHHICSYTHTDTYTHSHTHTHGEELIGQGYLDKVTKIFPVGVRKLMEITLGQVQLNK